MTEPMLPIERSVDVAHRVCAVCHRDGANPCDDCGRMVCELHAAGYRWVEAHSSMVLPNLCTVCETTRLLEDERAKRSEADKLSAIDIEGPTSESPAVQMLWWARHVWPEVTRDETGVTVGLTTRELDVDVAAVNVQVVKLLGRLGLAGMPDTMVAERLWALLADADVDPAGVVPVQRRFFAGYTTERGHFLLPLPGRLDGAPRVLGAVLTDRTLLWGQFTIAGPDGPSPVGGFEERRGHGGLGIAVLSAVARLVPEPLLA